VVRIRALPLLSVVTVAEPSNVAPLDEAGIA
jgi:hypothetical protein